MAEPKTKPNDADVDAFLDTITDAQKRADSQQLCALFEEITNEPAKMWGSSIVGFGTYHYKYKSGREGDWPIVAFSPRKNAITLYIMDSYKFDAHQDLLDKLGPHKTSKACLYIKRLSDVDEEILRQLISESVRHVKSGDFLL